MLFLNYTAHSDKLGVLRKDLKVGLFNSKDSAYFTLTKGLTVRDISEKGISAIGQFENNRFYIVITSEDEKLIDYKAPKNSLLPFGNYYSADFNKY
jgi:hypothetical protein